MVILTSEVDDSTAAVSVAKETPVVIQSTEDLAQEDTRFDDDATADDRSQTSDGHRAILSQFGFGAGMRMYEKSLAAARELETINSGSSYDYKGRVSKAYSPSAAEGTREASETEENGVEYSIPKPPSKGGFISNFTRTLSNISKASTANLKKNPSNVSRTSVSSTPKSNASDAVVEELTKAASVIRTSSNLSKASSVVQSSASITNMESANLSKAPSVSRAASTVSKADSVALSKAPSTLSRVSSTISKVPSTISKVPSTVSKAESIPISKTESIIKVSSTISKSPSTSSQAPIAISKSASVVSKSPSAISNVPSAVSKSPSTSSNALSLTKTTSNISKAGSAALSIASKASSKAPSVAPVASNISNVESKDASVETALEKALSTISRLITPVPSFAKEEPSNAVETKEVSLLPSISKAANSDVGAEQSLIAEAVEETSNEVNARSNAEISDDALLDEEQKEVSSHFGALCTEEELLIREGIHRGFIPGLEDQPFCAAEEAVRTWFYNADEMANAGPENLLPFDEVEEKKPDAPANKWFFW